MVVVGAALGSRESAAAPTRLVLVSLSTIAAMYGAVTWL